MTKTRQICLKYTNLSDEEICILEESEKTLSITADLINGDTFIDCMGMDGVSLVVAQGMPRFGNSQYTRNIVGEPALLEKEPAVYRALQEGVPIHDIKAITQQNKMVMQDVAPIQNMNGKTIAVLICERDFSRHVFLEEKITAIEKENNGWTELPLPVIDNEVIQLFVREANHRIKNNLQLISSICNLRIRKSNCQETKSRLRENANMMLTVAALHDILSEGEVSQLRQPISLHSLLNKVTEGIETLMNNEKDISIIFDYDTILVRQERAVPIALVVNELITNTMEHAFPDGRKGNVHISLKKGNRYATITVVDDGIGFPTGGEKGLGLKIATMMVKDKLDGELNIVSDGNGTKIIFSFLP